MADKKLKLSLSSKSSAKVQIRKDLFGAHDSQSNDRSSADRSNQTGENVTSPLDEIWGESNSYAFTQPTSNSLLLSPALKRTPNRFSTSPSPKKSPSTPKRGNSTPRKLSKYSPFRKKVYNPDPKDSIKRFFSVKEKQDKDDENQEKKSSLEVERINNTLPSTSADSALGTFDTNITQSQCPSSQSLPMEDAILKLPDLSTPSKNDQKITPAKSNTPGTPGSKKLSPNSKITGTKDVYASFLLRILMEALIIDIDPNSSLLNEEEHFYITTFNQLDQPSQRLYGRLLNRKLDWIRTSSMKYGDVDLQLMLLEQNGFITTDCSNENLEHLLNLLKQPELKALCKSYKLPDGGVKSDLVSKLISRSKQPSIKSYFSTAASNEESETNLRRKIYEQLGVVIKVTSAPQQTFSRCLLLFSYPHFRGLERDRFSDQLALVSQVHKLTFPSFDINRTNIFTSREHFVSYEMALLESSELLEAKEAKLWDVALKKSKEILNKAQSYLSNEDIMLEVEAMPDFLRRFTPGGCYVRAVTSAVEVFKKRDDTLADAETCLQLMLSQRVYGHHRRGQWYEQLALLYSHHLKDNVKATEVVLRGLRDEYIDDVSRHVLCARATMLEGRKKNGLKDYLKDALAKQRRQTEPLTEPTPVTISEQVLNSCRPGLKQVYVQDSEDGKMLSSVEEVAREHFRQQGYTHGGHDEGAIIKSVIFACFWEEIYGEAVWDSHGLFHSEYQTSPLDWKSELFFERRRDKLKKKLQDLAEGGVDAVINCFQNCHAQHMNEESVVSWKYLEHYDVIESLIQSIDIDVFLSLARLLLRSCRTYGAGFPDLTLWDPTQKKCIFVEVKSPNDHLSMKQKVWLHHLNKMGANAVVCHVKSIGCKSQKRKSSELEEI